jgi:hypothetical protein
VSAIARTPIPERLIPLWRRPAAYLALAFGAIGVLVAVYLILAFFHYQDRRPPQSLSAPEFGRQFEVLSISDSVEARITVTGGERSTYRAAGGTDPDHEWIELSIAIEAVEQTLGVSLDGWHAFVDGEEVGRGLVSVEPSGFLEPGDVATGRVLLSGIPTGYAVTITYQGLFDDTPLLTIHLPEGRQ